MNLYRPAQAARMAGISLSSIKDYTTYYAPFFSQEATPPPGEPRAFTPEDVRLLAFIEDATRRGISCEEIVQRLSSGELKDFDWKAPEQEQAQNQSATTLTPAQQLHVLAAVFVRQIEEARQREQELVERLMEAERRIGQLEGELAALRREDELSRPRALWKQLFGT